MTVTKPGAPAVELAAVELAAALLDVQNVAALLNCSPQHVRRLADSGKMPRPIRLGGLVRWRKTDLESWLDRGAPSCRDGGGRVGR
ncbi:MAG: helix-turn-helix domain-containing protein [Pirellulaceae bacterium]|nr:helix-turn-helix domain-containing protein [Pirellulaceae bacterium]